MSINTILSNETILSELASVLTPTNWVQIPSVGSWISNAYIGNGGSVIYMKGSFSIFGGSSGYEQIGTIPAGFTIAPGTARSFPGVLYGSSSSPSVAGIVINVQNNLRINQTLAPGTGYTVYLDGISYFSS